MLRIGQELLCTEIELANMRCFSRMTLDLTHVYIATFTSCCGKPPFASKKYNLCWRGMGSSVCRNSSISILSHYKAYLNAWEILASLETKLRILCYFFFSFEWNENILLKGNSSFQTIECHSNFSLLNLGSWNEIPHINVLWAHDISIWLWTGLIFIYLKHLPLIPFCFEILKQMLMVWLT